jgi:energy-coupling factor transporter ATP-binding protein EcfA2
MTETLNLLVITGPQAGGKTTLATALQPLLRPHIPIIDGEAAKATVQQAARHGGVICAQSDDAARILLAKIIDPTAPVAPPTAITFVTLEDRRRIDRYQRRADALTELTNDLMEAVYAQIVPDDEAAGTFKFVGDANAVMAAYTALEECMIQTNL